jgi:hypothetical protein
LHHGIPAEQSGPVLLFVVSFALQDPFLCLLVLVRIHIQGFSLVRRMPLDPHSCPMKVKLMKSVHPIACPDTLWTINSKKEMHHNHPLPPYAKLTPELKKLIDNTVKSMSHPTPTKVLKGDLIQFVWIVPLILYPALHGRLPPIFNTLISGEVRRAKKGQFPFGYGIEGECSLHVSVSEAKHVPPL